MSVAPCAFGIISTFYLEGGYNPNPMRIEPIQATDENLARLSRLARDTYAEAFGDSMSTEDLEHHLETQLGVDSFREALREDTVLIAGDWIGFVQFGPMRATDIDHGPADLELRRLYVLADHRGRGTGGLLMEAALDQMDAAPRVFLDVWEKNLGAIRFYERFGFKAIGERRLVLASGPAEDSDLIFVLALQ